MDPIDEAIAKKGLAPTVPDAVLEGVAKILEHNDRQVRGSSARMTIQEAVVVLREVGFKGGETVLKAVVRRELGRGWASQ